MHQDLSRRHFLRAASTLAAAGAIGAAAAPRAAGGELTGRIRKAVRYNMVGSNKVPHAERFAWMKEAGFEGVEIMTSSVGEMKELLAARDKTGLLIHGTSHGQSENLRAAIDFTRDLGGDAVLVVCRHDLRMSYMDNYKRQQASLREAVDHAAKKEVYLLVENVWASFLIEPLSMARFIDEVNSPWVQSYFDIGNNMRWGYPPHWIEVLGKRIKKVHVKEVDTKKMMQEGLGKCFDVEIGEGNIDWPAVRTELVKADFRGWASAEVRGGDLQRLQDISRRMDKVLGLA